MRFDSTARRFSTEPARRYLHMQRDAVREAEAGARAGDAVHDIGALQDVLGLHQDAVVTAALLRREAMRAFAAGENTFTYGLLAARQQQTAERTRTQIAPPASAPGVPAPG